MHAVKIVKHTVVEMFRHSKRRVQLPRYPDTSIFRKITQRDAMRISAHKSANRVASHHTRRHARRVLVEGSKGRMELLRSSSSRVAWIRRKARVTTCSVAATTLGLGLMGVVVRAAGSRVRPRRSISSSKAIVSAVWNSTVQMLLPVGGLQKSEVEGERYALRRSLLFEERRRVGFGLRLASP